MLLLREFIAPSQLRFEMPRLVHHWHRHNLLALCHFVNVVVLEAAVLIEVDVLELTLSIFFNTTIGYYTKIQTRGPFVQVRMKTSQRQGMLMSV